MKIPQRMQENMLCGILLLFLAVGIERNSGVSVDI